MIRLTVRCPRSHAVAYVRQQDDGTLRIDVRPARPPRSLDALEGIDSPADIATWQARSDRLERPPAEPPRPPGPLSGLDGFAYAAAVADAHPIHRAGCKCGAWLVDDRDVWESLDARSAELRLQQRHAAT